MPNQESSSESPPCSLASRSANEQLYGTAPQTMYWLLLEYPYPMGENAIEDSQIPIAVKNYLSETIKQIPTSRLLLIRQPDFKKINNITLFICISNDTSPFLYEFEVNSYEDIIDINLLGILKGEIVPENQRKTGSLFLVCTNGKRDPCCARHGIPLYKQMTSYVSQSVWQTSHVGGHRFAPNVILLPHGIYHGRVDSGQSQRLVDAYNNRHLILDTLRGRTCYPPEAQAAEYFLRKETKITHLDALSLIDSQQIDPSQWIIRFKSTQDQTVYLVRIQGITSTFETYDSCKNPKKCSKRIQYHLINWVINTHPGEYHVSTNRLPNL